MNRFSGILILLICSSCIGRHSSDAQKAELHKPSIPPEHSSGDTLKMDLSKSVIYWKGTKMRGAGFHSGEIDLVDAYFLLNEDTIVAGEFIVNMNSIKVTDIPPTDPVPIQNLTEHLKSNDFFDVQNFPTSRFEIVEARVVSGDSVLLLGNLKIKDVTRSIRISALKKEDHFTTTFLIDRFDWNMSYKGNWADRTLVDRDIELKVELFW